LKGGGLKAGFMPMVLSILGVVLFVTMFSTIMTALASITDALGLTNFIALSTIIGIAPTVLFLGGVFGAAFVYYRGYKTVQSTGNDTSGILRMVLGVLVIILFATLFKQIVISMNTLYTVYSGNASWIAFGTVISIAPTVLFLGGIFAGAATTVSGYRSRRSRRSLR